MWKLLIGVALIASGAFATPEDVLPKVKQGLQEMIETRHLPEYLVESMKTFELTHLFRKNHPPIKEDNVICIICDLFVDGFIQARRNGTDKEELVELYTDVCTFLQIESPRVCSGFLDLNIDVFLYIIDNKADVSASKFCSAVLQEISCEKNDNFEWDIEIPDGYSSERDGPSENAGQFNVIQISDIHYDPLYQPGKPALCNEPLCCQSDQPDAEQEGEATCGYWSDYNFGDTPSWTVDEVIRQVNEQHTFDYVYYTGDIISHRVWSTSQDNNTKDIKDIYAKMREGFDVPIFPIIGNHEPNPLNLFATNSSTPTALSTQWLFDLLAEEWATWLPDDALETLRLGGYYTVLPKPGFRIVVINSNVCYTLNWWLQYEDYDPYGQLNWLVQVLSEAEANDESVHILSHVPTGDNSCISVWAQNFNKILSRFANTVTGLFNGHTHIDEWEVYYNTSNPEQAVSVAFNGASVVPYSYSNPSYKVIHVNNETFELNNICEWTFNLTLANLSPDTNPEWYKLYDFKTAYDVPSLKAKDVGELMYRMAANQTLIKQFDNFSFRNSDVVNGRECNKKCQKDVLCLIATTDYSDKTKCLELQKIWDDNFA